MRPNTEEAQRSFVGPICQRANKYQIKSLRTQITECESPGFVNWGHEEMYV